jgi:glycosyltransferase involved in cell wall biosynthesis
MTTSTLSVIVPVYNEQFLVQASLSRLRVLGQSSLLQRIKVIVVDDASKDQTPVMIECFRESVRAEEWCGKFEWKFLRHEHNQGKGAALRTGLEYADTELTVFHDADLEYHPRDLLKMIPLFVEEDADAVFGSRFLAGDFRRILFFRHSLGNTFLTILCDLVCDLNLSDMETCYKMVRTELLRSIPLESRDFRIEPELTIKLAKRGAQLFEVPISYSGRTYQEGKKINWKDGVLALLAILKFAISDRIYTADEYGSEILARLSRAPRFTRWMADIIRPYVGHRVLEIGAGIGNLTVHLIPRDVYWATDVNPVYLRDQRHLSQTRPYLRTAFTDVTKPESFPAEQQFDTVICLNVVEHVEDDVAALKNIHSVLLEDGKAIVLVPQGPGLYGSFDKVLGHFRRYTREQLSAAAERAGFQVINVFGFNKAGVPAWWLNARLLNRKTFALYQIKMLNLLVPLFRKLEAWLPFPHLSLIAVLKKPATETETRK